MPSPVLKTHVLLFSLVVMGGVLLTQTAMAQWSTTALSQPHASLAATSVGDKAIFAGGIDAVGWSSLVDLFDLSTGTWSAVALSEARYGLAAASVGGKSLFAGGITIASCSDSNRVDIYDSATDSWSSGPFLSQARYYFAATSVGNKAMFAGGYHFAACNGTVTNRIDVYDSVSNTWSVASLSLARGNLAATTVGTKAFFAGGQVFGGTTDRVDVYDVSTNTWSIMALSQGRGLLVATTVGSKALFAGGAPNTTLSDVVDIYDDATGVWSVAHLSQARVFFTATSVGQVAIFAGGLSDAGYSDVVDIYDDSVGTWTTSHLTAARWKLASTTVGTKAMIAGGSGAGGVSNVVDVFDRCPPTTTFYADTDADGYGDLNNTITGCTPPPGYILIAGDCDDSNPLVHPGAIEQCNGIDDDCDRTIDEEFIFSYCTAKTNSLGCIPVVGSVGMPSQSGFDNFYVTASNVWNNKLGMMLWSLTPARNPFGGGTLCLQQPITRTPAQYSGGSSTGDDCTGAYAYHFSQTYMIQQLLSANTTVYAQYWSRDPGFAPPNNIGLTNALRFTICP